MRRLTIITMLLMSIFIFGCGKIARTKETVTKFVVSMEASQKLALYAQKVDNPESISEEDKEKLMVLARDAVDKAGQIDKDRLNSLYKGLGDHFHTDFVEGLKTIVSGYEKEDKELIVKGKVQIEKFNVWFGENIKNSKPLQFVMKKMES